MLDRKFLFLSFLFISTFRVMGCADPSLPTSVHILESTLSHDGEIAPVDPVKRVQDYHAAFLQIIQSQPKAKVYMVVKGISIEKIVGMKIMPQKTALLIDYKIGSKIKQKIVKVEDIEEFGTR